MKGPTVAQNFFCGWPSFIIQEKRPPHQNFRVGPKWGMPGAFVYVYVFLLLLKQILQNEMPIAIQSPSRRYWGLSDRYPITPRASSQTWQWWVHLVLPICAQPTPLGRDTRSHDQRFCDHDRDLAISITTSDALRCELLPRISNIENLHLFHRHLQCVGVEKLSPKLVILLAHWCSPCYLPLWCIHWSLIMTLGWGVCGTLWPLNWGNSVKYPLNWGNSVYRFDAEGLTLDGKSTRESKNLLLANVTT